MIKAWKDWREFRRHEKDQNRYNDIRRIASKFSTRQVVQEAMIKILSQYSSAEELEKIGNGLCRAAHEIQRNKLG